MTKETTLKEFAAIKGVGKTKAELLYNAGYHTLQELKKASNEDLTKIKGITKKDAHTIYTNLQKTPEKTAKKTQVKKPKKEQKKEEKKEGEPTTLPSKEPTEKPEKVEIIEETPETYKPKIKPKLTKEQHHQLTIRRQIKNRTPEFLREEWFRYKRIPKQWRRPDGFTSKMRRNYKYRISRVRVGFRGPREVRGKHPSGFEEILIYNVADLQKIDPKKQAARIGGTVGTKKRLEIAKKAEELEIRVLNMKV